MGQRSFEGLNCIMRNICYKTARPDVHIIRQQMEKMKFYIFFVILFVYASTKLLKKKSCLNKHNGRKFFPMSRTTNENFRIINELLYEFHAYTRRVVNRYITSQLRESDSDLAREHILWFPLTYTKLSWSLP